MISHFAYDLLTTLAVPPGAAYLALRPKHRPLLERFAPPTPAGLGPDPIWLQACSMGEVNAARPILEAMASRWPDIPLLLTTATIAGRQRADQSPGRFSVTWFPFDHRRCVGSFLDRIVPRALLMMETEVWPNAVRIASQRNIPVAVLNGRISDKHFRRYQGMAGFWKPVFGSIAAACAQNEEYAGRLRALGVSNSAVHVTGNTKFEGLRTEFPTEDLDALRDQVGVPPSCPVVVFGSMRDGDEGLAAECWASLRPRFPGLRLILVPRHLERVREVCACFDEPLLLRSDVKRGRLAQGERVVVVDVMGELVAFYALATVAVIGGSFYPGVEGHNPLESAALGVPTVFGPYMRNFIDPSGALLDAEGALQIPPAALRETLAGLLEDSQARDRLGRKGRVAVLANQGAIARSLAILEPLVCPEGR